MLESVIVSRANSSSLESDAALHAPYQSDRERAPANDPTLLVFATAAAPASSFTDAWPALLGSARRKYLISFDYGLHDVIGLFC